VKQTHNTSDILIAVVVKIEVPVRSAPHTHFVDMSAPPAAAQRHHPHVKSLVKAPARVGLSFEHNTVARWLTHNGIYMSVSNCKSKQEYHNALLEINLNPNPDAAPPATHAWLESMMPCTSSIDRVVEGRAILSTDKM
jgi:hypothetical protein